MYVVPDFKDNRRQLKSTIILISPYGSNDLPIRFTHSAVRQLESKILFNLC